MEIGEHSFSLPESRLWKLPAYICLSCPSTSRNHKPLGIHKNQLLLLKSQCSSFWMVGIGTVCLFLTRTGVSGAVVDNPQLARTKS